MRGPYESKESNRLNDKMRVLIAEIRRAGCVILADGNQIQDQAIEVSSPEQASLFVSVEYLCDKVN